MKNIILKTFTVLTIFFLASCNENSDVKKDTAQNPSLRPVSKLQKNKKYDPAIFPVLSDVYTGGASLDEDAKIYVWNGCTLFNTTAKGAPEGIESLKVTVGKGVAWFGWAVQVIPEGQQIDMGYFQKGSLRFFLKATNDVSPVKIGVKSGFSIESWMFMNEGRYGFKYDNEWHEIVIPLEDFRPAIKMNAVTILFMFSQQSAPPKAGSVYFIDGVEWKATSNQ